MDYEGGDADTLAMILVVFFWGIILDLGVALDMGLGLFVGVCDILMTILLMTRMSQCL